MSRALWRPYGGGPFLMSEVPHALKPCGAWDRGQGDSDDARPRILIRRRAILKACGACKVGPDHLIYSEFVGPYYLIYKSVLTVFCILTNAHGTGGKASVTMHVPEYSSDDEPPSNESALSS